MMKPKAPRNSKGPAGKTRIAAPTMEGKHSRVRRLTAAEIKALNDAAWDEVMGR